VIDTGHKRQPMPAPPPQLHHRSSHPVASTARCTGPSARTTYKKIYEDAKTFEALFYLLIQRFSPVDDIEMFAIEEMAAAHWRMRRVMSMEHAIFDAAIRKNPDKEPDEQTLAAFTDPAGQATLALLQRYEARFQSMYNRALRNLAVLRKLPARTPQPNEPKDTNVTPNVCNTERPEPTPIRPPQPAEPPAEPPAEHTDPEIVPLTSPHPEFLPVNPDIIG
jgi:hypothetical protein